MKPWPFSVLRKSSVFICLRPDGLGRLPKGYLAKPRFALLGCVNPWPVFVVLLTLAFAGTLQAQSPLLGTNSTAADHDDYQRRLVDVRARGEAIRRRLENERRERLEQIERERRRAWEEQTSQLTRSRSGYGTYVSPYSTYPVSRVTPAPGYYRPSGYSSYSSDDADECDDAAKEELRRQREDEDGFAAASGKCGDVTTQRIGNFFYHSDGTVTQKVGNFFYGPDGQVTQKVGNFYYHSDGTTTQRVGNFYYDSDGGVTRKIGSFYYHSGGRPCEDGTDNK